MLSIGRREWLWAAAVSSIVLAFSTAPYLAGYLAQTPQERFAGALLDRVDYHSHLAKMQQGYRGEWRYRLLFTPEDHEGAYLQTFYVASGHLARLLGLGLPLTYQIGRLVFGFLMLLSVYWFVAHYCAAVRTRRTAFLLATTASGLGWLTEAVAPTPPGGVSPMDFWLLDGFVYLALLTSPHFCAATGLLLTIFVLLLRSPSRGPSLRDGALAVLASLTLGLIHPYALLIADLVPALYWIIEGLRARRWVWRGLAWVVGMGVAQAPLLIYDAWVFLTQPVFAGWSVQNVTLSPPLRVYLWGYGVLMVLAALGAITRARHAEQSLLFPLLWVGVVALLTHLPWNLQRRFLEGVQVPLGLLAGVGVAEGLWTLVGVPTRGRVARLLTALVVALATVSNLYVTAGLTLAAAAREPALYGSADVLAGVDWLGANTSSEEAVLAGFSTGNLIPARIGHRVVLGHWMETVEYDAKRSAVARFFAADTPDAERRALAGEWQVRWLFHGPDERALGGFDPASVAWLRPAFRVGGVAIYRVASEEEP